MFRLRSKIPEMILNDVADLINETDDQTATVMIEQDHPSEGDADFEETLVDDMIVLEARTMSYDHVSTMTTESLKYLVKEMPSEVDVNIHPSMEDYRETTTHEDASFDLSIDVGATSDLLITDDASSVLSVHDSDLDVAADLSEDFDAEVSRDDDLFSEQKLSAEVTKPRPPTDLGPTKTNESDDIDVDPASRLPMDCSSEAHSFHTFVNIGNLLLEGQDKPNSSNPTTTAVRASRSHQAVVALTSAMRTVRTIVGTFIWMMYKSLQFCFVTCRIFVTIIVQSLSVLLRIVSICRQLIRHRRPVAVLGVVALGARYYMASNYSGLNMFAADHGDESHGFAFPTTIIHSIHLGDLTKMKSGNVTLEQQPQLLPLDLVEDVIDLEKETWDLSLEEISLEQQQVPSAYSADDVHEPHDTMWDVNLEEFWVLLKVLATSITSALVGLSMVRVVTIGSSRTHHEASSQITMVDDVINTTHHGPIMERLSCGDLPTEEAQGLLPSQNLPASGRKANLIERSSETVNVRGGINATKRNPTVDTLSTGHVHDPRRQYDGLTVKELQVHLRAQNLPVSGRKGDLIDRLACKDIKSASTEFEYDVAAYDRMPKVAVQKELRSRNLPVSGLKADLIAQLMTAKKAELDIHSRDELRSLLKKKGLSRGGTRCDLICRLVEAGP